MLARIRHRLASLPPIAPELLLGFLVLVVFVHPQLPTDDLLRHVVSYAWGYSHVAMYPLSSQTAYSQYPFFEWAAGQLSLAVTPLHAVKFIQLAAAALVIPAVYAAFRSNDTTPDVAEKRWNAVALTLLVLLGGLYQRVFLARPEVFALGWAVLTLSIAPGLRNPRYWLWLAFAPVVIGSYWLAWLTWPVLLVNRWSWRQKAATLAVLSALHVAFWLWFTGGDYLTVFAKLVDWNSSRLVSVSEGKPVSSLLVVFGPLAMVLLAVHGWKHTDASTRKWTLLALGPYLVLNMVRYIGAMGLCAHALLLQGWKALGWRHGHRVALACLMAVALSNSLKPSPVPLFKLPAGSRVLSQFDVPIFSLALANPGRVELLPSMEVGASEHNVQLAVVALNEGRVDCALVASLGVTHVVENRLRGEPPTCLKLQSTELTWRLWEVRK